MCYTPYLRKFYILGLFLLLGANNLFAANQPPIVGTTWGCQVGNNVYYDWDGTSNTSGGVTYYHFYGTSGRYTQWEGIGGYSSDPAYSCLYFSPESPANYSCSVGGTTGVRGVFRGGPTPCPLDNNLLVFSLTGTLFILYRYFLQKPKVA